MLLCYISFQVFYLWQELLLARNWYIENNERLNCRPALDEVLAQEPVSVEGLIDKGDSLHSLREYELSIGCYNNALTIDSNSSLAWYGKGCSLAELGKNEEAINSYNKALETFAVSSENWYDKGNELYDLKKYVEAINYYDKSIAADSYLSAVWFRKALASEQLNLDQETLTSYENSIELNSNSSRCSAYERIGLYRT